MSDSCLSEELWDEARVRGYFGGNKPIDHSTLYRGIKLGIIPAPIKSVLQTNRWIPSECRAARQVQIEARNLRLRPTISADRPTGRG